MKPRDSADQLMEVMREWLRENVEPEYRRQVSEHVKCALTVNLQKGREKGPQSD